MSMDSNARSACWRALEHYPLEAFCRRVPSRLPATKVDPSAEIHRRTRQWTTGHALCGQSRACSFSRACGARRAEIQHSLLRLVGYRRKKGPQNPGGPLAQSINAIYGSSAELERRTHGPYHATFGSGNSPALRGPSSCLTSGEGEAVTRTASATTTAAGVGCSIAATTVVSLDCSAATSCSGPISLAAHFASLLAGRRTLGFACFLAARLAVARLTAFLRAGLTLALPRFVLFLRAAARTLLLAIAISLKSRPRPSSSIKPSEVG
jgi:hypothetical protein